MRSEMFLPWISLSLGVLTVTTLLVWRSKSSDQGRTIATYGLVISTLVLFVAFQDINSSAAVKLLEPWPLRLFSIDALNAIPLPLFSAVSLAVVISAPKKKVNPSWLAGILIVTLATLSAYAAENIFVMVVGWGLSSLPILTRGFFVEHESPKLARYAMFTSFACLIIGILLVFLSSAGSLTVPRTGNGWALRCAFGFMIVAVFLRKGLIPAQTWVITTFERSSILVLTLFVNGHLGVFFIARLAAPLLPDVAHEAIPIVANLGFLTAAYTAIIALVEQRPRRLIALLSISQSSFLLVGIESNAEGIAGSLVHWQVVCVATFILVSVYTALEARTTIEGKSYLGLAKSAPRLAVFFVIGGLALVGLPFTLGFCAEDMLLHATLKSHPQFGVILPIVTALNAFTVMRLFASLFLGRPSIEAKGMPDALVRERWVLTAAVLFLVVGGLMPERLIHLPVTAAERLTSLQKHKAASRVGVGLNQ